MNFLKNTNLQKMFESNTYRRYKNIIASRKPRNITTEDYEKQKAKRQDVNTKLRFLRQNLSRAANRGPRAHAIEVDLDYVFNIGEKQEWKCAVSGEPLEFVRGGIQVPNQNCNLKSCTIDRIDSSLGYVKDNIQLVTWEVNSAKGARSVNRYLEHCQLVLDHNNRETVNG